MRFGASIEAARYDDTNSAYGAIICRDFRLLLSCLETGILPREAGGEGLSGALREAVKQRGDQLHVPAVALGEDADGMAGGDAAGVRFFLQGAHAADPHYE